MGTEDVGEPRIIARRDRRLSRWFTVVEKDVVFPWMSGQHTFHSVATYPYVVMYALTPDLRVPLVRQYRPAVDAFTWELPAGLLDDDTSAAETCRRELAEETGLRSTTVLSLGTFEIDTGRAEGVQHVFIALCDGPKTDFRPEPGTEVAFVREQELPDWIASRKVTSLPHIGAIYLARLHRAQDSQIVFS